MALGGVAWAQEEVPGELKLETVQVDGLRPVELGEVTSSVTVLDADDLTIRGAPFIADELRAVPGVAVSRSGARGGLTQIRLRGAEANHTLVLVDGIEVSDPSTGETDFGLWSGLNVSKIEVLRGEQSAIYGSDAIGGVISILTGGYDGWRSAVEAGSRNTYRGSLNMGADFDTGYFTLGGSAFQTGGVDTAGLGGEKDGSEDYSIITTGGYEFGEFTLRGLARYGNSEVETDPDLNFDGVLENAGRETDSEQWLFGGALEGDVFGLSHIFRASYSDVMRENSADDTFTDSTQGQRAKLSYSPSFEWEVGDTGHTLSGQIDYENEDYRRLGQANFLGDPNQSQSFTTYGIAAEYRLALGDFAFNASMRHDDNDDRFDNATTWRLGTVYNFAFDGRLRASIGTGVKNPTFVELFGFFPGSFVGNLDLMPEESLGWEIGWDQRLGDFEASAAYFSAELEDEVFTAFNPDFTSIAQNRAGKSERNGVEIGAVWQVTDTLTINGAATFINSENETGQSEIRVPETTGSISLDWQPEFKEGVRLGAAFDYVGTQDDLNFGTFPAARVKLDSYVLFSLTGEYPLMEHISLTVRGENLFYEKTTDVIGFNSPGAAGFAGLKLRN